MTRDIWLISDTHFNHSRILTFTDAFTGDLVRPGFDDVNHMNEYMVEKWNSVVKPGDIVYHLGDVVMGDKQWMYDHFDRLHGSKRLIVGNHDDVKFLVSGGWFKKVMLWRQFAEYNLLLSHVPLHESSTTRGRPDQPKQMVNVHGHTHNNGSPSGLYTSVCVEQTKYTPIHVEEIASQAKDLLA
jgi:calcineurin-like phosphoesterase family protein